MEHVTGVETGPEVEDEAAVQALAPVVVARRSLRERGMVSAEWAVGIIAAIAIAGVLVAVVTSGQVKAALLTVILTVIKTFSQYVR